MKKIMTLLTIVFSVLLIVFFLWETPMEIINFAIVILFWVVAAFFVFLLLMMVMRR